MAIDYDVLGFKKSVGSLQVRYYNEDLPEGITFSVHLPLVDGKFPEGDALDRVIRSNAPQDVFERARAQRVQASANPQTTASQAVPEPMDNFGEGQLFIRVGDERVVIMRAAAGRNKFPIPVEVA